MSGPEAAFVSLVSSPFVPSTTHFAATKASPSVLPIPCRYARQRTFNITASHAAETKPRSADPKTVDTSRFASTGKFNFDGTEFRNSVSGEWFGYQVTFSAKTGAAQNIEVLDSTYFSNYLLCTDYLTFILINANSCLMSLITLFFVCVLKFHSWYRNVLSQKNFVIGTSTLLDLIV